jgi:DNA-binding NarL/FixJ family response regulator
MGGRASASGQALPRSGDRAVERSWAKSVTLNEKRKDNRVVAGYSVSDHPRAPIEWHADHRSHSSAQVDVSPGVLILVERREFIRGCLTCWLEKHCGEIAAMPVADVESAVRPDLLSRSVAAVIGMEPSEQHDWLYGQVAWLRARHTRLPIILVVESDQTRAASDLAAQLDLQGYIPTFSSLEVAAAAVHLVVAGGSYFPRPRREEPRQRELLLGREELAASRERIAELTARERAVLGLLGSGMPNKVIAHRLGMSLSTVKAHVHHIIRKLKVGNRTEVALLVQHLCLGATEISDAGPPPIALAPNPPSAICATMADADASADSGGEDRP